MHLSSHLSHCAHADGWEEEGSSARIMLTGTKEDTAVGVLSRGGGREGRTVGVMSWLSMSGNFSWLNNERQSRNLLCVTQGWLEQRLPREAPSSTSWALMWTVDSSPAWRPKEPRVSSSSAPLPGSEAGHSSRSTERSRFHNCHYSSHTIVVVYC